MKRILGRTDGGLLMLLFNQRDEPSAEFACEMERLAALVADMEAFDVACRLKSWPETMPRSSTGGSLR